MRRGTVYHSALSGVERIEAAPMDRFVAPRVTALCHDIADGLPEEFSRCDVLWGECPWATGYKVFNDRAGQAAGRSFPEFMRLVDRLMCDDPRPAFIVTGKSYARYLRGADRVSPVRMSVASMPAGLFSYKFTASFGSATGVPTMEEVLTSLCRRFACVGDWCCGYGLAGRIFYQGGRSAVLSDFNPECIGAIGEQYSHW